MSDPLRDPWLDLDQPVVGPDPDPVSHEAIVIDPTAGLEQRQQQQHSGVDFVYRGQTDEATGSFNGGGTLTFSNGDVLMGEFVDGEREGEAVVISQRKGIARLCGKYSRGKLQGRGSLVRDRKENSLSIYPILPRGSPHSLFPRLRRRAKREASK